MNFQSTKNGKCDFPFFFIFNDLLVIENEEKWEIAFSLFRALIIHGRINQSFPRN